MRNSLHAHIVYLENLIQIVKGRLTGHNTTPEEVEDLQLQLTQAEGAVQHYRQAYELELSVSGSEPPDNGAGANPDGNAWSGEQSQPKKRDGLTAKATPVRKTIARGARRHSGLAWASAGPALKIRFS